MSKLRLEIAAVYEEMEVLLAEYREERAKEEPTHIDSYWQGKKDGLRTAMMLIYPSTIEKDTS